ncbi:hypothetical protein AB0I81_26120 [Nonomuraea sp. NPDC050404]|uniref:hypothetical protein n=1 Tax=Nonomuraea sp. NPDC050404 TaxID=3155783 RepID=UPI0033D5F63C
MTRKIRPSIQWQDDEQSAKRRQEAIQRIVGQEPPPRPADQARAPHQVLDIPEPREEGPDAA